MECIIRDILPLMDVDELIEEIGAGLHEFHDTKRSREATETMTFFLELERRNRHRYGFHLSTPYASFSTIKINYIDFGMVFKEVFLQCRRTLGYNHLMFMDSVFQFMPTELLVDIYMINLIDDDPLHSFINEDYNYDRCIDTCYNMFQMTRENYNLPAQYYPFYADHYFFSDLFENDMEDDAGYESA